jgi:hypothetical protein
MPYPQSHYNSAPVNYGFNGSYQGHNALQQNGNFVSHSTDGPYQGAAIIFCGCSTCCSFAARFQVPNPSNGYNGAIPLNQPTGTTYEPFRTSHLRRVELNDPTTSTMIPPAPFSTQPPPYYEPHLDGYVSQQKPPPAILRLNSNHDYSGCAFRPPSMAVRDV